ncbi:MAG: M24 family metallopeptidase [Candidatus Puniceispirillaceae bacterium]
MSGAPERGFPEEEFAARCAAMQAAMARDGVDAMLFTSEPEMRYFTGFLTPFWQSPTRPWFLVMPPAGKPLAVIPSIGAPLMRSCHVDEVISWSSPAAEDDGISLLADTLAPLLGKAGRLGMMMGRETVLRMPLADFDALRDRLPVSDILDMTAAVQRIRMQKSFREITKIRHICGLACDVFDGLPEWVHEGMPIAAMFRRFKIEALGAGVDDVSYLVGSAGPEGYLDIIAPPDERPLASGDVLMLDTGCVWDGYFCDFDRNFAIGRPAAAAQEAHRKLYDATEAALEMLRPGCVAGDLFRAMDAVLRPPSATVPQGDDVGRYGHGLGIQLTETPSHADWDETDITAGMVLTLEPSISYTATDSSPRMMVAEENVLVTAEGPELLTRRATRELPVIG